MNTRRTSDAEHRLARVIARRCRGKTAVLGPRWPKVLHEILARDVDVQAVEREALAGEETFDTVVLLRMLERHAESEHLALLEGAWQRLSPDGRLVVCVPNGDHGRDPEAKTRFTRAGLKRLLQRIDRPHLMKDQPYRWLVMWIDARPRLDRASHERHESIADLCRGRVLELGCAHGHLCAAIAGRGLAVEGVDKSRLKIAGARRLFPDIPFRQVDILELPVAERHDTVILAEVLEHVPEETGDRMLAKAWEAVAEGGRLIVSVPNDDCVPHANHVRRFRPEDLSRALEPFGAPRHIDEQPFKWLTAYVNRPTPGTPPAESSRPSTTLSGPAESQRATS
jgi:2-polyprenyl-3-methyl-5-hydroxy-6-metoxy-1,4-benzoquinol methylase